MKVHKLLGLAILGLAISACGGSGGSGSGGGGGGGDNPETGVFLDSRVEGVRYSGDKGSSGYTNASGEFNYLPGETITFMIGDIELGSTAGGEVVTPIDLAGASGVSDPAVTNIVQMLVSLDEDGDPDNGITITSAVDTNAVNQIVDVQNADNFTLQGTLDALTGGSATLVDEAAAQDHLESWILAAGYGVYEGTYSFTDMVGTDSGTWTFNMSASGVIKGTLTDGGGATAPVTGQANSDGTLEFSVEGDTFTGNWTLSQAGNISSSFSGAGGSGSFSGQRALGSFEGEFAGTFSGADTGTWSASIDADGNMSVTINGGGGTDTTTGNVSGSGTSSFTLTNDVTGSMTVWFDGHVNGTWNSPLGSGTLIGAKTSGSYAGTCSGILEDISLATVGTWSLTIDDAGAVSGNFEWPDGVGGTVTLPISGDISTTGVFSYVSFDKMIDFAIDADGEATGAWNDDPMLNLYGGLLGTCI